MWSDLPEFIIPVAFSKSLSALYSSYSFDSSWTAGELSFHETSLTTSTLLFRGENNGKLFFLCIHGSWMFCIWAWLGGASGGGCGIFQVYRWSIYPVCSDQGLYGRSALYSSGVYSLSGFFSTSGSNSSSSSLSRLTTNLFLIWALICGGFYPFLPVSYSFALLLYGLMSYGSRDIAELLLYASCPYWARGAAELLKSYGSIDYPSYGSIVFASGPPAVAWNFLIRFSMSSSNTLETLSPSFSL